MLFLAPQSGEEARMQIQERGTELRDRTAGMMGDAMAQVRMDRTNITMVDAGKPKNCWNTVRR
jgi:gas vesicle protein